MVPAASGLTVNSSMPLIAKVIASGEMRSRNEGRAEYAKHAQAFYLAENAN